MTDDTPKVSETQYADACVNLLRQWNNWGGVFSEGQVLADATLVLQHATPERVAKFGTLVQSYARTSYDEIMTQHTRELGIPGDFTWKG